VVEKKNSFSLSYTSVQPTPTFIPTPPARNREGKETREERLVQLEPVRAVK
jgi:hypothetical protein